MFIEALNTYSTSNRTWLTSNSIHQYYHKGNDTYSLLSTILTSKPKSLYRLCTQVQTNSDLL